MTKRTSLCLTDEGANDLPDPSLNGAEHHPNKDNYATTRHVLDPEKVYNYNNGKIGAGYEHPATGKYLTPDIQTAPGKTEQFAAQENLALPADNDASFRSDATINPTLENGQQHNVVEGTAAPQNTDGSNQVFKGDDGIDRHGGGRQILTNGGYGSGGVSEGIRHNIDDSHYIQMDPPDNQLDYSQLQANEPARDLTPAELGYHGGEAQMYDENKSDFQNAQDDLDYANQQEDAYNQAVKEGRAEEDPTVRQQLADSKEAAQNHLDDIKNGQAYSYDKPSDYWNSPEGRQISGDIHSFGADQITKRLGEDPTGSVSNASKDFGRFYGENYGNKVIGKAADTSQAMMSNAYDQYGNQTVKDMNHQFPFRDQDGNPVDAAGNHPKGFTKK